MLGLGHRTYLLQSRVSPFANRRRRESVEDCCGALANPHQGFEELSTWSNFKNLFRSLPLVKTSPQGLHGCVAFEVEWASVRGINYSNELLVSCVQEIISNFNPRSIHEFITFIFQIKIRLRSEVMMKNDVLRTDGHVRCHGSKDNGEEGIRQSGTSSSLVFFRKA